jgi:hypothetical protein
MRDITALMSRYRECARNLWNVYFSTDENIGGALDSFDEIRRLLFDALVVDQLCYEGDAEPPDLPPPQLRVVPRNRSEILIEQLSAPGEAHYWGEVRDLFVGPDEITLEFIEYFDFSQSPIKDFRYFLCRILRFPEHTEFEGRRALIDAIAGTVFHDEEGERVTSGSPKQTTDREAS